MIKEVSKIRVSNSVIGRFLSIICTNSSVAVCPISNAGCRTTVKAGENKSRDYVLIQRLSQLLFYSSVLKTTNGTMFNRSPVQKMAWVLFWL
jgi:hypothetical protein